MAIAQKEANETEYWLELLYQSDYLETVQYQSIISDIQELNKILASIIITSKEKKYGKR
jgi:four helix bundle protein